MAQLSKGDTFADGQQLTAARLNQLVDSGQILAGAITEQTAITAGTLEATDATIVSDAGVLKKATIGDVLGSNVPVVTSAITAGANKDVVVTPNDGTIVTGQAYTSADGLTVTVTSTAHGLVVGQVILVTAAATGYNGTFRVATVATNSFTYVMTTAATAGSATLSYTKKGAVRNAGNKSIAGNLYVDGSSTLSGNSNVIGDVINNVNFASTGAIKLPAGTTGQRPASPVAGQTRLNTTSGVVETYTGSDWSSPIQLSGTNDFTGGLKINGTTGFMLYSVQEEAITNNVSSWTSATFTKPADEMWLLSFNIGLVGPSSTTYTVTVSTTSGTILTHLYYRTFGTSSDSFANLGTLVLYAGKANTADNIILSTGGKIGNTGQSPVMKMVVVKYKTATGNLVGGTTALNYINSGSSVTITSPAHGIAAGAYVNVFASNPLISGRYQISTTTIDTFTYANNTAAGSGTCSYFA